ncbi:MAG TPA: ATP-dependent DNA helicase RecQ [Gemmatimonadaceae bacterium]|nr:ATP-dependent DNA helicase RecQ [Gemmatimonadaceae bacterium]
MSSSLDAARDRLHATFGYADFRPGQVDVVTAVLSGRDTLGVLPTGGGKSLCYQVPALVLPGLTVVVSPLISLMKDQVDRLESHGVPAALLNSTLGTSEVSARLARVQRGELKLLYVAPERLEAPDLQRCLGRCQLSLLAVDEAHCISEWGHDFRPSFRRIAHVSDQLGRPQVVALTATATPSVRRDIMRQLRMRSPAVVVGGFDRVNLHYAVRSCRSDTDKDRALIEVVRAYARPAIVYASTRSSVERLTRHLTRSGVRALPYHAGLDGEQRHAMQESFMRGAVDTIVATNAFGMGIDKPDVRLVVHYAMPGTVEAYYQEAGRAGRDGAYSHCVLLHAHRDRFTHEWFINGMYPAKETVRRVHDLLRASADRGRIRAPMQGRETESAVRVLERHGVVFRERGNGTAVRVRLMATPVRIRRELGSRGTALELGLLRALWRVCGTDLDNGVSVDLHGLPPGIGAHTARTVLERLRERQFVDFQPLDEGLYLSRPELPLSAYDIDWETLERRRCSDMEKLETIQRYAITTQCRRAFVLRYFGESRAAGSCGGCDNCPTMQPSGA